MKPGAIESEEPRGKLNVRIFKNRWFARFARQEDISDGDLCETIERAERGLVDADLGGNVIKQRIARPNEGRSGGFRSLVAFRTSERSVFVFGFPKNKRDNIGSDELKEFRELAKSLLSLTEEQLESAIHEERLVEVNCDEELQK